MVKKLQYVISFLVIIGLAIAANRLSKINVNLEYPIWAAVLGIIAGNIPWVSSKIKGAARTEFFIKVGLVLLGASINFSVVMSAGWRGIVQALIGVPLVFFATWYIAKLFGLDEKLRAVMASALSICGVSAAIASAGSVGAKREHLTYVITLVCLFALPMMVLIPMAANALNLPHTVAGAWAGNNIDTTAAVTGAGQLIGKDALSIASIVKMAQNTLIGVAAFLLALYFAFKGQAKPKPVELWNKFPKFVIGFVIVSVIATLGYMTKAEISNISAITKWCLCLAFVSIGMGFSFKEMRTVGGKPLAVFAIVTLINTMTALGLAWLLFGGYKI